MSWSSAGFSPVGAGADWRGAAVGEDVGDGDIGDVVETGEEAFVAEALVAGWCEGGRAGLQLTSRNDANDAIVATAPDQAHSICLRMGSELGPGALSCHDQSVRVWGRGFVANFLWRCRWG